MWISLVLEWNFGRAPLFTGRGSGCMSSRIRGHCDHPGIILSGSRLIFSGVSGWEWVVVGSNANFIVGVG